MTDYVELHAASAFSFLRGASLPETLVERAATLGVESVSVAVPNLADDVDTVADLQRLHLRLGPRSQMVLASLPVEAAS